MSELKQLKDRINDSGYDGVLTEHIRDDYEPAGRVMIQTLVTSGEFITRRDGRGPESPWTIWATDYEPK